MTDGAVSSRNGVLFCRVATVAPVVDVDATVQALLAYLRERDQQRDREVAELGPAV